MNTHADKTQEKKSQSVVNAVSQKQSGAESTFQFVDNRPEAVAQRKLQEMANNSTQVKQLKALQEMANNSPQVQQKPQMQFKADTKSSSSRNNEKVVQRVLNGSDLTREQIGTKAKEYGLHQWNDGEFIASEKSPETTYEIHVHNYGVESEDDDNISITGHAVWKKQFGTANRNQQALTITGQREGDRWSVDLDQGDERIDIPASINTDGKTALYDNVVNELDDIVKDALNED
jgi:hypothetical protein